MIIIVVVYGFMLSILVLAIYDIHMQDRIKPNPDRKLLVGWLFAIWIFVGIVVWGLSLMI